MNNLEYGQWPKKTSNIAVVCADTAFGITASQMGQIVPATPTRFKSLNEFLASRDRSETDHSTPILIDLRAEMDGTESELSKLGLYCQTNGTRLVVVTELKRIDAVYGQLPVDDVQYVIGDDPYALLLALTTATRSRTMDMFFDHKKDQSSPALSKISADLAEFARALSRIVQAEEDGEIGADYLADKPRSYAAPMGNVMPFHSVHASEAETTLDPSKIRNLIRVRRLRDRFFNEELFADPAWDILLDLLAARIEGTKVSVSSLCIAAAVPATTALRWIKSMTDGGYLERRADPTDARRVYIHLCDETARKMAQYMHAREELSAL